MGEKKKVGEKGYKKSPMELLYTVLITQAGIAKVSTLHRWSLIRYPQYTGWH